MPKKIFSNAQKEVLKKHKKWHLTFMNWTPGITKGEHLGPIKSKFTDLQLSVSSVSM